MPHSKYAPDEIQNGMFQPLIKKALIWSIGGRRKNLSLFSYNKILCPLPHPGLPKRGDFDCFLNPMPNIDIRWVKQ